MHSLNIITLGCSKNTVDSEVLAAAVAKGDVRVYFETKRKTDAVLINTCGFIGDAKRESVETVLHWLQMKEQGQVSFVFVMGCLVERYARELREEMPAVDGFFGLNDYNKVFRAMKLSPSSVRDHNRLLSTPDHYAYLKISEGCDRRCSFCAIPMIRGKHRSRTMKSLMDEAKMLAERGVRELNLIAQDTTMYGLDLYGKRELPRLLDNLAQSGLFEWIRLHYAYPAGFPAGILKLMRDHPSVCRYIDIPLQHISDPLLKSMKRGLNAVKTRLLLERIRKEVPGVAIRTAFIVGYPGETRAHFNELLRFVEEQRFERAGVFTYSPEEGTSAFRLGETVSERTKSSRAAELMSLQQEISESLNQQKVGQIMKVIIDRKEGEFMIGRTEFDSPEVDNEVLVSSDKQPKVGQFCQVAITGAEEFDLVGKLVQS